MTVVINRIKNSEDIHIKNSSNELKIECNNPISNKEEKESTIIMEMPGTIGSAKIIFKEDN
jgi:hypothetical protein